MERERDLNRLRFEVAAAQHHLQEVQMEYDRALAIYADLDNPSADGALALSQSAERYAKASEKFIEALKAYSKAVGG